MLSHEQVWQGIDRLALRNQMSPSGLAKRAGLDPTTFNKSKRITKEGKLRWPSTESVAKVLDATRTPMRDFVRLIDGETDFDQPVVRSPRLRFTRLGALGEAASTDAAGFPSGNGWEEIDVPLIDEPNCYVIELDRDVGPPTYRSGDLLVVSPASGIRRGDRVVARLSEGDLVLGTMLRRTTSRITIARFDGADQEQGIEVADLVWMVRIVWVSQ